MSSSLVSRDIVQCSLQVAALLWGWDVLLLCLGQLPFLCLVILHGGFDCILSEHAAVELYWWKRQVLRNLAAKMETRTYVDRCIISTLQEIWNDDLQVES